MQPSSDVQNGCLVMVTALPGSHLGISFFLPFFWTCAQYMSRKESLAQPGASNTEMLLVSFVICQFLFAPAVRVANISDLDENANGCTFTASPNLGLLSL